jgi:MFS family permease
VVPSAPAHPHRYGGRPWGPTGPGDRSPHASSSPIAPRASCASAVRWPRSGSDFRLHFVGQVLSNVGTWFQNLAQSLLVLHLTHSAASLGLVSALQFAPLLLLGAPVGVLLDRTDRRRVLLCTSSLAGLFAASLGIVTVTGHVTTTWIYAFALGLGFVQAFDRPAGQSFVFELVDQKTLPNAVSLNTVIQSSARVLGPGLGALLYAASGAAACFFVNGASYLIVLAAILAIRRRDLTQRPRAMRRPRQLREGVSYVWSSPTLRGPILANFLIGTLAFNFMTTITATVQLHFGAGATDVGLAHSTNAAGAIAGGLLIGVFAVGRRRRLVLTCLALAATMIGNALAPDLVFFLAWAPIFGFTVTAYQATMTGIVQSSTAPEMQGRVMSLVAMGSVGTTPIGALISGAVIDAWGTPAVFYMGAASCLLAAVGLSLSAVRRRRSAAPPVIAGHPGGAGRTEPPRLSVIDPDQPIPPGTTETAGAW